MRSKPYFILFIQYKNPDETVTYDFDYPEERDAFIEELKKDKRYVKHGIGLRGG